MTRLNHRQAQVFIETFLYEYFGGKNIYIVDSAVTPRNEGRNDEFMLFTFTLGANFREDEEKFAKDVMHLLMVALNDNFDNASVEIDWTDWVGVSFKDSEEEKSEHAFPEARFCVLVY